MLSSLLKDIEEYVINLQDSCSKCGGSLKVIGKELIRTEVEYIPAKLKVKQILRKGVTAHKVVSLPDYSLITAHETG